MNLNKYIATKSAKDIDGSDLHNLLRQGKGVKKPKGLVDDQSPGYLNKKAGVSPLQAMQLISKQAKNPSALQTRLGKTWANFAKQLEKAALSEHEKKWAAAAAARKRLPRAPGK